MALIIDTNAAVGSDKYVGYDSDGYRYAGQTFITSADYSISDIKVRLKKYSTPADNFVVRIETVSTGIPTGTLVNVNATATKAGGDITTSYVQYTLSLTPFALPAGTYAFTFTRSGAAHASAYYAADGSASSTYADGNALKDDGASGWTVVGTQDVDVELYGTEIIPSADAGVMVGFNF